MRKLLLIAGLLVAVLCLYSCSGGSRRDFEMSTGEITSIRLSTTYSKHVSPADTMLFSVNDRYGDFRVIGRYKGIVPRPIELKLKDETSVTLTYVYGVALN
jgi:hypothetical protein